jgi:peptidylprolyl isomerase/FKBP-type peptidyl-prolyl cis-trans isomerase SlpA
MTAKEGDQVKVHYTGKLPDGSVFDSSREREPLDFQLGSGQMIPGFEKGVIGMNQGDTTTIEVSPEDGFGERNPEAIFEVSRQQLPEDLHPQQGQTLEVKAQNGQRANVVVQEVKLDSIVLDANHPLAGETLIFDIELLSIDGQ